MKKFRLSRKALLGSTLAMTTLLTGCAQTTVGEAERAVKGNTADVESYLNKSRIPLQPANVASVQYSDGVWATASVHRSDHGDPLPFNYETNGVTVFAANPLTIFQAGELITRATGVPVSFDPDVSTSAAGGGGARGGAGGGAGGGSKGGPALSQSDLADAGVAANTTSSNGAYQEMLGDPSRITLNQHQEPLSRILDNIAGYFGLSWTYDGNRIRFFRYVTRTYHIRALPIDSMSMSSNMTSGASSSSGSSGQSTKSSSGNSSSNQGTNLSVKIWTEVENGVSTLLNGRGKMSASHASGTITVTAPAPDIEAVQRYIDGQNRQFGKQVAISVELLSLQLTDGDDLSFSLNAAFSQAAKYGLDIGTGGTAAAVKAGAGQALKYTFLKPTSSMNGSNAVAQMLSSQGRVSVVTRASVMTLNGLPAPLQVAHTQGYLAQVQTTLAAISSSSTSNSQTTLTPGSVTTGFDMSLLPVIEDGGRNVLLQFNMSLSDLNGSSNGFDTFSSGNQTIQLPNVISRNFSQEAEVPNGATLVMAGFEQNSDTSNKTGTGTPSFIGLGGNQNGSRTRTMIVVVITPVVESRKIITYE